MAQRGLNIWRAGAALEKLNDPKFIDAWEALAAQCAWATPYQGVVFVTTWFKTYAERYQPVVIARAGPTGDLDGLFILAQSSDDGSLCAPGAHQAEYQSWLAADNSAAFFVAAMAGLCKELPDFFLHLKYVLPTVPLGELRELDEFADHGSVHAHARPLWQIDAESVEGSLRKKSNKSRVNRLKRLGELSFELPQSTTQFAQWLDVIGAFYDLRQGAINDSVAFGDDPLKAPFHVSLHERDPEFFHSSFLCLDGQPVSAHIGVAHGPTTHLSIVAHQPQLSKYSPGKIHLLELARKFAEDGRTDFDLTPGDDPWKERFATDHDQVYELRWWADAQRRSRHDRNTRLKDAAKRSLDRVGLLSLARRVSAGDSESNGSESALWRHDSDVIFTASFGELTGASNTTPDPSVRVNDLRSLLAYRPAPGGIARQALLRAALANLERGQTFYTLVDEAGKLGVCWAAPASRSVYLPGVDQMSDFDEPVFLLHGLSLCASQQDVQHHVSLIASVLSQAQDMDEDSVVAVVASGRQTALASALYGMGFSLSRSIHRKRFFGRERTYQVPDSPQ